LTTGTAPPRPRAQEKNFDLCTTPNRFAHDLYQGTTSVVPKTLRGRPGFSRCGRAAQGLKPISLLVNAAARLKSCPDTNPSCATTNVVVFSLLCGSASLRWNFVFLRFCGSVLGVGCWVFNPRFRSARGQTHSRRRPVVRSWSARRRRCATTARRCVGPFLQGNNFRRESLRN